MVKGNNGITTGADGLHGYYLIRRSLRNDFVLLL